MEWIGNTTRRHVGALACPIVSMPSPRVVLLDHTASPRFEARQRNDDTAPSNVAAVESLIFSNEWTAEPSRVVPKTSDHAVLHVLDHGSESTDTYGTSRHGSQLEEEVTARGTTRQSCRFFERSARGQFEVTRAACERQNLEAETGWGVARFIARPVFALLWLLQQICWALTVGIRFIVDDIQLAICDVICCIWQFAKCLVGGLADAPIWGHSSVYNRRTKRAYKAEGTCETLAGGSAAPCSTTTAAMAAAMRSQHKGFDYFYNTRVATRPRMGIRISSLITLFLMMSVVVVWTGISSIVFTTTPSLEVLPALLATPASAVVTPPDETIGLRQSQTSTEIETQGFSSFGDQR